MNPAEISQKVFSWFQKNREEYIFRKERNPYRIWISEVALQQTRVNTVLPVLEKFFLRFPDLKSLYGALEEEVLLYWSGLGYYSRARQIHKAAKYLVENCGGFFPNNYQELLQVPSIGPYTAAMILSFCFEKKILALDGNLKRIFGRIFAIEDFINSPSFLKKIKANEEKFFLVNCNPGEINEAFMEFGQKICRVKPLCHECFLQNYCLAYQKNLVAKLPKRPKGKGKEEVEWLAFWIEYKDKVLIQENSELPLLKGMYILPSVLKFFKQEVEIFSFPQGLIFKRQKISVKSIRHAIMHYKIYGFLYSAELGDTKIPEKFIWISKKDLSLYFYSSLMKKFLAEYKANLFVPLGLL